MAPRPGPGTYSMLAEFASVKNLAWFVLCLTSACSARPGSVPVPPSVIASAADTRIPDAGDAAAPAARAEAPKLH
ncbi:MAG TPA: hypothetical protein VNW92_03025 [Polyangiaceae bacterium]|nr:hypothetical protein [Polyangiaceae bacterium]